MPWSLFLLILDGLTHSLWLYVRILTSKLIVPPKTYWTWDLNKLTPTNDSIPHVLEVVPFHGCNHITPLAQAHRQLASHAIHNRLNLQRPCTSLWEVTSLSHTRNNRSAPSSHDFEYPTLFHSPFFLPTEEQIKHPDVFHLVSKSCPLPPNPYKCRGTGSGKHAVYVRHGAYGTRIIVPCCRKKHHSPKLPASCIKSFFSSFLLQLTQALGHEEREGRGKEEPGNAVRQQHATHVARQTYCNFIMQ